MAATFFGSSEKTELLTEEVQQHDKLDLLVERCEEWILSRYRSFSGDSDDYLLRGYADSPADMEASLLRALRLTIARLVEHRASAPDAHVARFEQGERSYEFRASGFAPRGLYRLLRPFDLREPLYL